MCIDAVELNIKRAELLLEGYMSLSYSDYKKIFRVI